MQTVEQLMALIPIDCRDPDFYRGNRFASIRAGARYAPADLPWAEFGVAEGDCIPSLVRAGCKDLHLFDSFEGLPSDWHKFPKGSFACNPPELDRMPEDIRKACEIGDVEITVHKGLFAEILSESDTTGFYPAEFGLVHMDADLYESTMDVLKRIKIFPGQVFVFDEFYGFRNAELHEQKAWYDFVELRRINFEYLARTAYSQVVIRVKGFRGPY